MIKPWPFIFTLLTMSLLALITFASGNKLGELSTIFDPLYNITFYSPFDDTPFSINYTHIEVGGHFFIFLAVGLVLRQWLVKLSPWICLIILSLIAGSSEFGQGLVVGRTTGWDDFLINIIAGSIGVFISNIFQTNRKLAQIS